MKLKHILSLYFDSWWVPSATCVVWLGAVTIAALSHWPPLVFSANVLLLGTPVVFLGILAAIVWNFIKKRWRKGVANLLLLPLCVAAAFIAVGVLMFGPSEDGFADNLSIPTDIEIAEPLGSLATEPRPADDSFQRSILDALAAPGNQDPTITATITALAKLEQDAAQVLRRYLATSPSWRVFTEHGNVFATRRWMIGSQWRYTLHGYYTRHDIDTWPSSGIPNFQSRFTIGLSGKPWARVSSSATRMSAGQTGPLVLSTGNRMHQSRCIITAEDLVVEIFEQSETEERRLTKATLAHLEAELAPLVAQPDWETIRANLPPDSIRQGEASLELRNSFQPGLYDSIVWINPGEPGMIYLKAFEVTAGTPLSIDRLKEKSNEWVGWSDNPGELFFANSHFTIYEGDWGKPYAARFEVWFVPDSGGADRKFMERVFRIEGWQR